MKLTMQDWSNIGISYGETVDIKGAIDEYLSGAGRHNVNRDDSSSNVYDVVWFQHCRRHYYLYHFGYLKIGNLFFPS